VTQDRTRILLVEMPRLLCDILRDLIDAESDMVVAGEAPTREGLPALAQRTRSDIVVLGADQSQPPPEGVALLEALPHVRLIGVSADGRSLFLYERGRRQTPLGQMSPRELWSVIRATARADA
jgi:DNA-binding NarL/FixJ family response regulator